MTPPQLVRTTFATPRAAEFLERRALQSQTGLPSERFGDVVVKELLDNALDASEITATMPEIEIAVTVEADLQKITVTDNGTGMPADVIDQILDFNVLVSDKAAYRSPTRGLQGNAWKTLLGIPYALGVTDPVLIEAQGDRHEIAVSLDPGGNVVARHDKSDSTRITGTTVTVPLPINTTVDVKRWTQNFAAVNPHATLVYLADGADRDSVEIYKATAQDAWRKPLPTDPTSPHWYDEAALTRLVFAHIGHARRGGEDMPLGRFLAGFDGLSSTAKQRKIREAVPGVRHLSDFADAPDQIGRLLAAMRTEARVPKPHDLGEIAEDHYRAHMDAAFGVERFWFRRKRLLLDGVPWLLEVAIAETLTPGAVNWAVNYGPTYGDPFGRTRLAADGVTTTGAASFLSSCDAFPDEYENEWLRAVAVHVVCPSLEFVEKSKTALTVPGAVAEAFATILAAATKQLRAERKRAERDIRAETNRRNQRRQPTAKISLKDAVFAVLSEAIAEASAGGTLPFPSRNLYYAVRPRIQRLTHDELKMDYFSQTLLVDFEREHGAIHGHYRDPRGELREPHTGKVVRLGTREVATYQFPEFVFDKFIFVEKEGLNPIFEAARLAERYDLAIASGKGQPAEAARALFERAQAGHYRLFVLHDADPAGYSIARTIAEETPRMPGYSVEVIDLGLTVAQAIDLELPTERFTRTVKLPWWMPERLNEPELEWFTGRRLTQPWETKQQFECTRVELNALGAAGLIALVEAGLEAHGAATKVIPPDLTIRATATEAHKKVLQQLTDDVLGELFDLDAVVDAMLDETADLADLDHEAVESLLFQNGRPSDQPWRKAVTDEVSTQLQADDVTLRQRIRVLLAEQGIGAA